MLIHELAKDIHENAVAHGWWEGERDLYEVIALIHSEWSEALEEARAGRPMVWHRCMNDYISIDMMCEMLLPGVCGEVFPCYERDKKPEGIAVELMDGVIRILDLMASLGKDVVKSGTEESQTIERLYSADDKLKYVPVPHLVAILHALCSKVIIKEANKSDPDIKPLLLAVSMAMTWVRLHGCDPLEILLMKHEYNKQRPYKHGKKF